MAISSLKPIELFFRRAFLWSLGRVGRKRPTLNAEFKIPESPSILILRQDRLGDLLMSSFFLIALRDRFPGANIAIVLGKNNVGGFPLLPIECKSFLYSKNVLHDFSMLRAIRETKFDLAIDLTDKASVTSSILMALSGAKIRLGVQKENATVYDITVPQFSQYSRHVTERVAEMLRPLGIDPETVDRRPRLKINYKRVKGRVGINVSARTSERSAPPEAMAKIAQGVLEMGIDEVIVFSAPHDRERGEKTVRLANNPSIQEAPSVSNFTKFAEQVASCEYLISVDTSITQIASATGLPMVLLLRSEIDQYPWIPIGSPFEIHRQHPDMKTLEPQPVLNLFKKLIAR